MQPPAQNAFIIPSCSFPNSINPEIYNSNHSHQLLEPPLFQNQILLPSASLVCQQIEIDQLKKQEWIHQMIKSAHQHFLQHEYQEARNLLVQVLTLDTLNISALLLLGCISYAMQDYMQSIQLNQRIIEIAPEFAEAYSNLGRNVV